MRRPTITAGYNVLQADGTTVQTSVVLVGSMGWVPSYVLQNDGTTVQTPKILVRGMGWVLIRRAHFYA
eukprot:295251-Pleurochrysis_carterae.AAC.2